MSLLQQITSTRPAGGPIPPVRMNIQGTDGIGKSTFGAGSIDPIFIQAEDGLSFINASTNCTIESFTVDYLSTMYY